MVGNSVCSDCMVPFNILMFCLMLHITKKTKSMVTLSSQISMCRLLVVERWGRGGFLQAYPFLFLLSLCI